MGNLFLPNVHDLSLQQKTEPVRIEMFPKNRDSHHPLCTRNDDCDDDNRTQDRRLRGLLMGHQSSFAEKKRGAV